MRPNRHRQGLFRFYRRARRLDRWFKIGIVAATIALVAILLSALAPGRYLASWAAARGRWLALRSIGLEPDRSEIDDDWRRKRLFDIAQSQAKLASSFAEYDEAGQRLLRFAGLDPDHVLIRWGNFNRTVLLPSTVFEADDSGRSYRLRPNMRSIWVRNFPMKGDVKAYFQVPATPAVAELIQGTGAAIVEGSIQTTNTWGLRGPEPNVDAPWRGIILGDSYVQGLFVGDDQTPTECLKRDLKKRFEAEVEILNTGHLGYSAEQYYYTLKEYAERFPSQFVVVSFFANDFGDLFEVLKGRGDWEESAYWLNQIYHICNANTMICVFVPAPWVNQIDGLVQPGYYPGMASNELEVAGNRYLDPLHAFVDAHLAACNEAERMGSPLTASPLFNGRIGDGHFSAQGCEVWAAAVGQRLFDLMMQRNLGLLESRSASPVPVPGPGRRPKASPANHQVAAVEGQRRLTQNVLEVTPREVRLRRCPARTAPGHSPMTLTSTRFGRRPSNSP